VGKTAEGQHQYNIAVLCRRRSKYQVSGLRFEGAAKVSNPASHPCSGVATALTSSPRTYPKRPAVIPDTDIALLDLH
jgi:hypothetical protein